MRTFSWVLWCSLSATFLVACSDDNNDNNISNTDAPVAASCDAAAAQALQMCISAVSSAEGACYFESDTACDDRNADILTGTGSRTKLGQLIGGGLRF